MSNASCKVPESRTTVPFAAGEGPIHAVLLGLTRAVEAVLAWQERARQRHHLAELSEHHLKDMGLSRADVQRELAKPFWTA